MTKTVGSCDCAVAIYNCCPSAGSYSCSVAVLTMPGKTDSSTKTKTPNRERSVQFEQGLEVGADEMKPSVASFPGPAQLSVACSMFVCGESLGTRLTFLIIDFIVSSLHSVLLCGPTTGFCRQLAQTIRNSLHVLRAWCHKVHLCSY